MLEIWTVIIQYHAQSSIIQPQVRKKRVGSPRRGEVNIPEDILSECSKLLAMDKNLDDKAASINWGRKQVTSYLLVNLSNIVLSPGEDRPAGHRAVGGDDEHAASRRPGHGGRQGATGRAQDDQGHGQEVRGRGQHRALPTRTCHASRHTGPRGTAPTSHPDLLLVILISY